MSELRTEIGSDAYFGGLVVEQSAGLNPARLTLGLADLAEAAGAVLHEETRAIRILPQADGRSVVETSRGAVIATDVIVGTNGYTGGLTPSLRRRIMAISSFIIATEPLPPDVAAEVSPHRRLFFDTKNFLYYWRLTPDNRMLFGGRASMWPTSVERAAAILQRAMVGIHPQLWQTPIAHAWGGRVAFTFDRMVHAGRADGVTYAVGCCGSGVAVMPWLGMRVAEWVGGGDPPAIASLSFPLVPAPYEGRAWFLPLAGEYWKAEGSARGARGREGPLGQPAQRRQQPVDVGLAGQVIDDPRAEPCRAAERGCRQPAVAGLLERRREPVLVGVEVRRCHRARGAAAAGQVTEAHDAKLGSLGERLEVVRLSAAGGEVCGDVVVALDEPAEAAGAEVLPGRPQLERAEAAGPLEAELVEVQLAGVASGRRRGRRRVAGVAGADRRLAAAVVLGRAIERLAQVPPVADEQRARRRRPGRTTCGGRP